jgi:hypothetical protein
LPVGASLTVVTVDAAPHRGQRQKEIPAPSSVVGSTQGAEYGQPVEGIRSDHHVRLGPGVAAIQAGSQGVETVGESHECPGIVAAVRAHLTSLELGSRRCCQSVDISLQRAAHDRECAVVIGSEPGRVESSKPDNQRPSEAVVPRDQCRYRRRVVASGAAAGKGDVDAVAQVSEVRKEGFGGRELGTGGNERRRR